LHTISFQPALNGTPERYAWAAMTISKAVLISFLALSGWGKAAPAAAATRGLERKGLE
jgi:hypothetical protein